MLQLKWDCVHNASLAEYLKAHSDELQMSCKQLLAGNRYGSYLGRSVLQPNMSPDSPLTQERALHHVLQTFHEMNPEYYFHNFEIHLKDNTTHPTPMHSDCYTWLYSDDKLVNQVWILLYNDFPNNECNLDLYENNASDQPPVGLLTKRSSQHIVTLDGYDDFKAKLAFDGSQLKLGDILVFQNGVVHATSHRPTTGYRMALAMSFYKKSWNLTTNLVSHYRQFWETDQTKPGISSMLLRDLSTHPYARKIFGIHPPALIRNPEKREKEQDEEWYEQIKTEVTRLLI